MSNPYSVGANQGTTASITFHPVATGAGDVLVATLYTTGTVKSVSDTQSNQYILVNAGGGVWQFVTTGKTVALATSDTVTGTLASSAAVNFIVVGVPGAAYAGVDACAVATGSGTAPSVASGVLGSAMGEVAIAASGNMTGSGTTWGGGFTTLTNSHGSLSQALNVAWLTVSGSGSVTASTTITSATWTVAVVTLQITSFVGNPPVPPTQYAGSVAASADMNMLAKTALFLARPPMVVALGALTGSGQAIAATTNTAVQWSSLQRDTDGFWTPASNTLLTVQTKGVYRVRFTVPFTFAGANCGAWVSVTTGVNNPIGSGISTPSWYAWSGSGNSINGCVTSGGIIPAVLYPLDFVRIIVNFSAAGNIPPTPQPATCVLKLVST